MADERKQKQIGIGHHASAMKRDRQSKKRRIRRRHLLTQMRGQIKLLRAALDKKDKKEAETLLKSTLPVIAKMGGKKIIHHRTAARYSSRLTKQFNSL